MPTTIIVVLDEGDSYRGDITFAESVEEAQRKLEAALQSGVDRARIRVFAATEHSLRVTYRPIVQLGACAGNDQAPEFLETPEDGYPPEGSETLEGSEVPGGSSRFSSLFRTDPPIDEW